ncbi:P-loop NTPase fold protein [Streptomyces sp. NPDC004647]|uniref:P-loop NTPase fold protein n=1 Tax=Streptomyces sp. NPDC004647 TaxID=3154671 RepID=UPI0033B2D59F
MTEPDRQQFSLLNDEPVTDAAADLLGAGRAAEQLAGLLVASRHSTPFTMTVDAGWGTGKSSLMRLVDAELARTADVHTVWYNAWTSTGADALEGLIKSVLMRFDRRLLRRALQRVSEHRALIRVARAVSMVVAGPLGVAGLADELWKSLSMSPQARNEMRDAIRDLAQEWAETGEFSPRRLLVVFIDDLDRCSEETVLAVCEAVKVYLDVPGLAFVIGCDRSALAPNGLLRDLSPAGSAFMEKILQTSYRIPVPDGAGIEEFVRRCARDSGIHALFNDELISLVADRSGRNPRRIKRLINGFVLEVGLNPLWQDFGPQAVDAVIRTLLLQYLYPDFYRMLVGSGAAYGDVLTEFLTYREVRRALRQVGDDSSLEVDLTQFCAEHEVRPPAQGNPEGWGETLAELESQLPSGFPALAADRGFTSLIEDLMELPQSAELIQRLRQQPLSASAEPPGEQEAVYHMPERTLADERGARADQLLGGKRILWIDDNPDSVEFEAEGMRRAGASVAIVKDRAEAERHLAAEGRDLLISDITRGTDYDAGFTDVERLRNDGFYSGPVIFYTGRVTPAREARAEELGALGVTASPGRLQKLAAGAALRGAG